MLCSDDAWTAIARLNTLLTVVRADVHSRADTDRSRVTWFITLQCASREKANTANLHTLNNAQHAHAICCLLSKTTQRRRLSANARHVDSAQLTPHSQSALGPHLAAGDGRTAATATARTRHTNQ